jgi:hypothetical protein
MITANVKRFMQIQDLINDQIGQHGQAEIELTNELDTLGGQLSNYEISVMHVMMYEDALEKSMACDDAEWSID